MTTRRLPATVRTREARHLPTLSLRNQRHFPCISQIASLFRAYDVRGIVGETLTAADFLSIGHAFASHVADVCQTRTPLIVVMRDGRESSPNLSEAFIEGMLRAGAHVLDAGMGPTPDVLLRHPPPQCGWQRDDYRLA
jgi:hypothetical protein